MAGLEARRVVCGRTEAGGWGVVHDGPATATEQYQIQGASFDLLNFWADDELGLDPSDRSARANLAEIFSLAPGATRFLIESMAPHGRAERLAPHQYHRLRVLPLRARSTCSWRTGARSRFGPGT